MAKKKKADPNDWFPDAEPSDENDPAYKEEIFETLKFMNTNPEKLTDPEYRAEYVAWLKRPHGEKDDGQVKS